VVKLRYSLAHIHYTIHHHSLKSAKNIITHCPKCCYSLSLKRFNAEETLVMQKKICEEIKRGKCPEPQKERKRVRREVKWTSVWSRIRGTKMPT